MVRSKIKLVVGVRYSLYKVIRTFHDHRARVCRKVRLMLSSQEMFRKLSVSSSVDVVVGFTIRTQYKVGNEENDTIRFYELLMMDDIKLQ